MSNRQLIHALDKMNILTDCADFGIRDREEEYQGLSKHLNTLIVAQERALALAIQENTEKAERIETLEAASRWIPMMAIPKYSGSYWCQFGEGIESIRTFSYAVGWIGSDVILITAWRPLPEPPEAAK